MRKRKGKRKISAEQKISPLKLHYGQICEKPPGAAEEQCVKRFLWGRENENLFKTTYIYR
jgi:hypothetical protein